MVENRDSTIIVVEVFISHYNCICLFLDTLILIIKCMCYNCSTDLIH